MIQKPMIRKPVASAAVALLGAALLLAGCGRRLPPDPTVIDHAAAGELRGKLEAGGGGAVDSAAPAQNPTGLAMLSGTFKIGGTPPPNPILNITGNDQAVCKPGGSEVRAQQVAVGPEGGIANIVIYAEQVPDEWVHDSAKPGKIDEVTFDQRACAFLTHVLAIQVSQPILIKNSDPVGHNTKFQPREGGAFNQIISADGGSSRYQPVGEEREPFAVSCNIHPWMRAWIVTRSNSYFAVTDEEGKFDIANLPAGVPLRFRVWHEKARFRQVDLSVNDQSISLQRRRFTLTLDGENPAGNQLNVLVPAGEFN